MPRDDYKTCKACGRHVDEAGPMSRRRLCAECGEERLRENIDGIHFHRGPAFTRWRRALAASVGAVLLDEEQGR